MADLFSVLSGVGVFLIGMIIMTKGLKSLAGARLSQWLADATHSPWSGAATGAISTAILQSSSATTVATVGFVGAGLLSFPNALGIIFGANIGTTITGWLVALVGFKLNLSVVLSPLIFVGALMQMFGSKRTANAGYALAGFGIIFIGINLLQQAASGYADFALFEFLPPDSWYSRLKLLLLGVMITVITQSSSAGVATTLVAINAGVINFEQAAALVVGMDVGTTVTAAIATIGGSVETQRTGFSHVIYNCFTAVGALILISPFTFAWQPLFGAPILTNPEIALVAFHTTFNVLGTFIVLPFTAKFANMMQWIIKDRRQLHTAILDKALLKEPMVALMTAEATLLNEFMTLIVNINLILEQKQQHIHADMLHQHAVLGQIRDYLDQISINHPESQEAIRLVALIHAADHMQRLHERCEEDLHSAIIAAKRKELSAINQHLDTQLDKIMQAIEHQAMHTAQTLSEDTYQYLDKTESTHREMIYQQVLRKEIKLDYATECVEAIRWLTRVSRHISRICYYLNVSQSK